MPVNRKPNVMCDRCSTQMYRRPSTLAVNAGKFCSRACRNAAHPLTHGNNFPGPKFGMENPAWKGGVMLRRSKGNYRSPLYVRCPTEFRTMARSDGYVMEHRLKMAQRIGRCLLRREVVHHVDHNSQNNENSNLWLFPCNRSHKLAEVGKILEGSFNNV